MRTSRHRYRVPRNRINLVHFILEAYDNLAVVSTVDSHRGLIEVAIAPGCEGLVERILLGLGDDVDGPLSDDVSLPGMAAGNDPAAPAAPGADEPKRRDFPFP